MGGIYTVQPPVQITQWQSKTSRNPKCMGMAGFGRCNDSVFFHRQRGIIWPSRMSGRDAVICATAVSESKTTAALSLQPKIEGKKKFRTEGEDGVRFYAFQLKNGVWLKLH